MKSFYKIFAAVIAVIIAVFVGVNLTLSCIKPEQSGRPYRVEISRAVQTISRDGIDGIDFTEFEYITDIQKCYDNFYDTDSDYTVKEINGQLYRFDYTVGGYSTDTSLIVLVNISLAVMALAILLLMLYIYSKILTPFEKFTDLPYELSKGNLTSPMPENKSRFFGKFMWGIDLLRENMEQQKNRELNLQKEKKTLLLSLSHDIKTPLSAIKLYSKALSKGLYKDSAKQLEIAKSIDTKADEIEKYVSQIINASREDFLTFEVNMDEFYLSELIDKISAYYTEKLSLIKTEFKVNDYSNCLINGDLDRSIEVIQNIIENAIKYGDGKYISVDISEEENCKLITVKNSGCTLSQVELPHIFDSFWRGANSENSNGNGLGLYICRQLMNKMNGEVFAKINNGCMEVTGVFVKA